MNYSGTPLDGNLPMHQDAGKACVDIAKSCDLFTKHAPLTIQVQPMLISTYKFWYKYPLKHKPHIFRLFPFKSMWQDRLPLYADSPGSVRSALFLECSKHLCHMHRIPSAFHIQNSFVCIGLISIVATRLCHEPWTSLGDSVAQARHRWSPEYRHEENHLLKIRVGFWPDKFPPKHSYGPDWCCGAMFAQSQWSVMTVCPRP